MVLVLIAPLVSLLQQRDGGGSDSSAPCCGMSGWPSPWPWPSFRTIPQGDRRWPGPGVWGHEQNHTAKIRKPPHTPAGALQPRRRARRGPASTSVWGRWQAGQGGAARHGRSRLRLPVRADPRSSCAADGGLRDGRLADAGSPEKEPEPPNVVDRVLRRTVDQIVDAVPGLPALDVPVPQMVENVTDTLLRILDFPIAEQVIEVPTISCSPCPSRSPIPEPQMAEQLVEVPTVLSPARIALRIAEQIVDTPVPQGRGERRGQGFLPGHSSTAISSSLKRICERTVEQIVDIPSSGGGLAHESSSSAGPVDEDFTGFFFRTFPHGKECGVPGRSVRTCPGTSAHGLRRLMGSPAGPLSRRRRRRKSWRRRKRRTRTPLAGLLLRSQRSSVLLAPSHASYGRGDSRICHTEDEGDEEEEKKEEEETSSRWPRSSSALAVAYSCSSRCVPFLRWQASAARHHCWYGSVLQTGMLNVGVAALVIDTGSGIFKAGFAGSFSRCVLSGRRQAPDASHHGRYGPEELYCAFWYFYVGLLGSCDRFSSCSPCCWFYRWRYISRCALLPRSPAHEAQHHGRYGPEGFVRHVQGLVCWVLRCPSRCAPLGCLRPRCPSSWLEWTTGQCGGSQVQFLDKVFCLPVGVLRVASWSRQCRKLCGDSTGAAHLHGHLHLRRGAEQTIEIPLCSSSTKRWHARWCATQVLWSSIAESSGDSAVAVLRQRVRTCPSWCNDRRWSRRADNCGVTAVAVLREARGDSKVQFMDTVVFMRKAPGDATGAVL